MARDGTIGKKESSALEENLRQLMRDRSIGGIGSLRDAMAQAGQAIGNSTLLRALQGGEGIRLSSLGKLAAFFDVTVDQLLQPDLGRGPAGEESRQSVPAQTPPEYIQLLQDLEDLPPARRARLLDHIHELAEEARESAAHLAGREKPKHGEKTAAARRGGPTKSSTSMTYGDGNRRQRSLPLTTVADPFTAEPGERESALYRRIERAPKEPHGGAEEKKA